MNGILPGESEYTTLTGLAPAGMVLADGLVHV